VGGLSHTFKEVRERAFAPRLGASRRRPLEGIEERRVERRIGEAEHADAAPLELALGAQHEPGAGRIQAFDTGGVQLDVAEIALELAQLLVQRRGFVGDPIPAEDETQNILSPLCPVPGVRFITFDVAQ
jgi:hypothetical protein